MNTFLKNVELHRLMDQKIYLKILFRKPFYLEKEAK